MAWDEDGTIFWSATTTGGQAGTFTSSVLPGAERTIAEKGKHNNEGTISGADILECGGGPGSNARVFQMIFPEKRDVYAVAYWAHAVNTDQATAPMAPRDMQYSVNTTNGIDGTWVSIFVTYPISPTPWNVYSWDHWYRIGIVSAAPFPVLGVRAIRWRQDTQYGLITTGYFHHIHVYGDKATGATPDRLLFIDNVTGLEFTKPLDWGDVPRGTTLNHAIKIKNNSATLTANTVLLDFEALTGLSDQWHTMSDSGGAYGATLTITSIAPGASYPAANVITIKLVVGPVENLGPNSSRLQASTVSWT